jgi:ATP-binding cassette subfamily B protein
VVFQNDFLFADTIRENIDFGRNLTDEQIEKAAFEAQAGFVYEKEDGLDSLLAVKGANFSGGQKQRILIARALAAHPEILILDDSSSALDYRTDAELRRALSQEFKETTAIIVAQRVSSIMSATKIMMLEDGHIIGYGSHDELMELQGKYAEMFNLQAEKYKS